MCWAVCALAGLLVALATSLARAAEVRVPLTIDYLTLGEAIRHQLYTAPGDRAALWNGPDECQFLYAENPTFSRAGERVQLETTAALSLGVALGSRCVSPLTWSGIVEAESEPYLARGIRLMLHIADMNLYNPRRQKTLIAGRGFDLIKRYLVPRMETFSYDLNPALQQLGALAEAAATPAVAERIRNALATVRADPTVTATDDGVKITLIVAAPEVPEPVASETPAQPTPAELEAFEKQLDEWDAFLVFAVKQLGAVVGDRQFRSELLEVLLTSRYRLTQALASPPSAAGPDPVRTLFVDTWQKLGLAVRAAARRGQFGSRGLQFLSFISAGDALFALDQAAPALGMRISSDDLRRLAHIMAPDAIGDPLEFNFAEDPELRRLLGPTLVPLTSTPESSPSISSSPVETPGAPGPSSNPSPTPQATPQASGWLHIPWSLIEPRDVCAAEPLGIAPQLNQIALRLRRIVVDEANALEYRGDMERLLELSVQRQLEVSDLDARFRPIFDKLVRSAAWQESCWRQFIRRDDRVTWLESSTGDIGLMQVNKHVWRGFYNLEKLKWDVLYNAGAGTEILMQMTQQVLTRPRVDPTGSDGAALARSVYASYNGGPDAYSRWRHPHEASPAREIDAAFLDKYHAVERGQTIDILSCAAAWGHRAGR
ncbi:MAG TPA: lytic transglycosylase domain-containing protein [Candidatus Binataceae bacterium]